MPTGQFDIKLIVISMAILSLVMIATGVFLTWTANKSKIQRATGIVLTLIGVISTIVSADIFWRL